MSLRLRLALWYGVLLALILLVVTVFSYAFHARGHYDDLDRALITTTSHAADEAARSSSAPVLMEGGGGFRIIVRIYTASGALTQSSASADAQIDPRQVLRRPTATAFDPVAGFAPPITAPEPPHGSAFGLLTAAGERWRIFVLPMSAGGIVTGYVEALAPLGDLDHAMQVFRELLLGLSLFGLAAALAGSWMIARGALWPITRMIQTAETITRSRDLSQRIKTPQQQDEIGRLARTFNGMLASIQSSYSAQQRFVSDASHELRAPLTAIQANLDLVRHHPEMSPSEREEAFAEAERESGRLARLVADLLALARADAGVQLKRDLVDLDVLALESCRSARQLAHGQQITLDPFEPVQVRGDEDRLRRLLVILIDNALKYTPEHGSITIGVRAVDANAELVVRDTGIGVAPEDLPHVFERFYRADPARGRDPGGTGLGLAIAQWIVEQHGGTIQMESQSGQGATIMARMPAAR